MLGQLWFDLNAEALPVAAAGLFGYVIGSVPFGLLFGWLAGAGDVRHIGSGNIGATNVLRTGNRWAAAATLLCDGAKGAGAVLVAGRCGTEFGIASGLGAFLGHLFPVWLNFRGGKGVATFFGVLLALDWRAGLLAAATWLVVAALWRISSLSALVAAMAAPIYFVILDGQLAAAVSVFTLSIIATHRENILRLTRGEEPRIGSRAASRP